jgi:exonuclease VII large subunit
MDTRKAYDTLTKVIEEAIQEQQELKPELVDMSIRLAEYEEAWLQQRAEQIEQAIREYQEKLVNVHELINGLREHRELLNEIKGLIKPAAQQPMSETRSTIIQCLKQKGMTSISDLQVITGINYNNLLQTLKRMKDDGLVTSPTKGYYKVTEE